MTEKRVKKALKHPDRLGAGAKARKDLTKSENAQAIKKEFERGTLHSGSGKIVTNPAQARAITRSTNKGRKAARKKA
jgi:hypothetical protein